MKCLGCFTQSTWHAFIILPTVLCCTMEAITVSQPPLRKMQSQREMVCFGYTRLMPNCLERGAVGDRDQDSRRWGKMETIPNTALS